MRIQTRDANGKPNGWVLPVWNSRETEYRPAQVYVTAVAPFSSKGPHLHRKRSQNYRCIVGHVQIISRNGDEYTTHRLGPYSDAVIVPAGTPSQIINLMDQEAILVNCPDVAWASDDQDEWPVEDWKPC